jgi:glutamate/tyrosine decarboxylase-like PLP-dependent enzyme
LHIKELVNSRGRAYISSTVLDGRRVLRLVVMNPRTTVDDIHGVLEEVERSATREVKAASSPVYRRTARPVRADS